jgi:hypothetical protein
MNVKKVCCQGCGADLEVDESIRFVTCNFCGSKLEIVHDATTTHSRLLEKIGEKTERMSEDLRVIRLQNEIEQLDREWDLEREGLMPTNKEGVRSKPSAGGSVVGAGIMVVFGLIWMTAVSSFGGGGFALVGLIFIGAAIWTAVAGVGSADRYRSAEAMMNQRRRRLLEQLEAAKRNGG